MLTPRRSSTDRLLQAGFGTEPELTDACPPPPGRVYCTTVYDFKGLESAVVILADIRRWPPEWDEMVRLLYVGCSRARNHLIVLVDQNAPARVRRAFTVAPGRK